MKSARYQETTTKEIETMNRRSFLTKTAAFGALIASTPDLLCAQDRKSSTDKGVVVSTSKLTPLEKGSIPVAVLISQGATVIDFSGPWDVFGSVMIPERGAAMEDQMPFQLFMVSDKLEPITAEGGMKVFPDYTFANVPACKVVVVPAQRGSKEMHDWLAKTAPTADVTMSVCVGVTHLAKAGLLAGKSATIHHDHYDRFAKEYPDIDLKRWVRFVENEKVSTSGGESCGMDLSLRIVERYFGRRIAENTAHYIEYNEKGWMV
jgi:transcriptional regulator GlxA family with amidase domain